MADNNKCYFEGTIWQPQTKTSTNGTTTWSAKLSVYKSKAQDGTYQYTQLFLRAYGAMAEALSTHSERDKIAVYTKYRSEEYKGKYYNFFQVEQEVQPQPQQNNSPYAQSYRRPVQQQTTIVDPTLFNHYYNPQNPIQVSQDPVAQELQGVIVDDDLPF